MSTPFNASQAIKDSGLGSGEFFKPKEGHNKLRLMSPAVFHSSWFKGTKSNKFVGWVFDYASGNVRLYFMPVTVMKKIEALQLSEEYAFDSVPMPYDIDLVAKSAGTIDAEYDVIAARQNTPVPIDALNQMDGKKPIETVIEELKVKDAANPDKQPPTHMDNPPMPEEQYPTERDNA